jgi:hypothetical protein
MPATTVREGIRTAVDRAIHEVEFSAINNGETFTYVWPSNLPNRNPTFVRCCTVTPGVGLAAIEAAWTANNVPSSAPSVTRQLTLRIYSSGDLTNAVVRVYLEWLEQADGGLGL